MKPLIATKRTIDPDSPRPELSTKPVRPRRTASIFTAALAILATLALPSAALAAPAAPVNCTVTTVGSQDTVTWPQTPGADEYIIYRTVNNSPNYWRGRTTNTTFNDTNRNGTIVYSVASKTNNVKSTPTTCTTNDPVDPGPTAPANCTVTTVGSQDTVTWPQTPGADEYIIYRTVNNSPNYWRGRTTNTTFNDTNRNGTIVYSVASKTNNVKSTPTTCTTNNGGGGDNPLPDADVVAVGDFARCNPDGAAEVGELLDVVDQPIWGLGDYAYPDGTLQQLQDCFGPKLGRHKARFSPVVGNHEYHTPGAAGYFEYFGAAAGDPTKGYYSQDRGTWQVLFLNTNCSQVACGANSAQYAWLKAQLEARPNACRAVVMHHPRWSSWGPYANAAFLDDMVTLLHDNGTDIILTGHAHHYERLERVDPNQQADPTTGFRHFTVGTGGITPRTPAPGDVLASAEKLIVGEFGVLGLELNADSYSWEFMNVDQTVLDSGSDTCIN